MSKRPEDTEFDDELLDRSYERLRDLEPPSAVDRQIMALATSEARKGQAGSGTSWRIWRWRIATVTVAILAFSVTLRIVTDAGRGPDVLELPVADAPQDSMSAESTAVARSAPVDEVESDASSPTQTSRAVGQQEEVAQAKAYGPAENAANSGAGRDDDGLAMESSVADAPPRKTEVGSRKDALSMLAEPVVDEDNLPQIVRSDPDRWLDAIDDLLEQGRDDWARRELELFRERNPGRTLDAKYDID